MRIFNFSKSSSKFLTILVVLSAASSWPAAAQTGMDQDMPRLPSVNEYRLPPGDTNQPAQKPAAGPVDEGAPPPVVTPRSNSAPPEIRPQPKPGTQNTPPRSAPTQRTAPPPPRTPAQTQERVSQAPANIPANPRPETSPPIQIAPADSPEVPITEEPNNIISPPPVITDSAVNAETEPAENAINWLYIFATLGALAALAFGFLYLRKRKTVEIEDSGFVQQEPADEPQQPIVPVRKTTPKIYSPPNPVAPEPKPSPVNAGGFITTKVGATRTPATAPIPQAPAVTAAKIPQSGDLTIEMVAEAASSTLLNAVVSYSVTLTNTADKSMTGITLSGALLQADQASANQPAPPTSLLHDLPELAAGETVVLSGDLRLPLGAIQPINVNSQALFIPLVWFAARYQSADGMEASQSASFLVGREHEPKRPKMAPFRLDLGPRNFGKVGTRAVTI